ncbi:MAG: sensor histidine kinase [Acidimicrobiales bacterium]
MGLVTEAFQGATTGRRPTTRQIIADVVLAAILGSLALAVSAGLDGDAVDVTTSEIGGLTWLLLIGPAWVVGFRRLAPGAALFAGATIQALVWSAGLPNTYLAMTVLLYSAVFYGSVFSRRAAWVAGVLLTAYTGVGVLIDVAPPYALPIVALLSMGSCALATEASGRQASVVAANSRAEALEMSREADRDRALADERARIARELHDVVAHGLSVIVVQAAAARRILEKDPAGTASALEQIEQTGRTALGEMRQVLSVIRTEPAESWQPAPGLHALDELVAELEGTGLKVTINTENVTDDQTDDPGVVPATVDLTAYRIVQESLTNVLKHGGQGATAAVDIKRRPSSLDLQIVDNGRGAAALDAGGHGLQGMQERVEIFGGQFAAGPKPDGGFLVSVSLPIVNDGGDSRA